MHIHSSHRDGRVLFRFLVLAILGLMWLSGSQSSHPAQAAPQTDFNLYLARTSFEPRQYVPITPSGLTYSAAEAAASGVYILQFTGPVMDAWKDQVTSAGAQLGPYIPNYAFIARLDAGSLAEVQALPFVRWVGPYQPAYKLAPGVSGNTARAYKVILAPWASPSRLRSFAIPSSAPARTFAEGMVMLLDASGVDLLARQPDVLWIEPYYINKAYNNVAGGSVMNGSVAWANGYTGAGVTIAVADTGLDTGTPATMHLDFMNGATPRVTHIASPPVPSADFGGGCYIINSNANDGASDIDSGHGTHVTGSVAGNGARSSGLYKGLAYDAAITFQAVEQFVDFSAPCASFGLTDGYYLIGIPDDVRTMLAEVYNWGARVQNDSWGGGSAGAYDQQASQFDDFTFTHPDFTVVVAAGNDGVDASHDGYVDNGSVTSPATAKNVIAVGATENNRPAAVCGSSPYSGATGCQYNSLWPGDFAYNPTRSDIISDDIGDMAAFSSRGPAADGRFRPDVVAPGTDIISTHSSQTTDYGWGPISGNTYYEYMGGTSMASPLTAGAAAVVRQFLTSQGIANPSAALIKADLIHTAVDIPGYGATGFEAGAPIPNNSEGWGRVDVGAATTSGKIFLDGASLSTGGSFDAYYMVNAGAPFKVTLAWSDYPAAPLAGVTLVNNLNLRLTAPDGSTTYLGNVFTSGWSATGGSADTRNNVENVYIQNPIAGLWRVEVLGQNVPSGPQPYALVLSGNIVLPDDFNKSAPGNGVSAQSTSPTLSWGSSTGAARYEYCIDTISGSACNTTWTSTVKNTSVALSGLSYSTTYYWQVRAVNGRGETYANTGAWWSFTTEVNPSAPEIVVEAPGPVNITDGGAYFLGTTTVGTPLSRTITVRNTGTGTLHLLTDPPATGFNFTASSFGSTSLASGASTTFELTCKATLAGPSFGDVISFDNDDGNENPFNFYATCTVNPPPAPEIVVEGPGPVNIPDGGSYDLGSTFVGTPLSRTITIRNTGAVALTLLTNPPTALGDFTAGSFGATTLDPDSSTTFTLTCDASSTGSPVTGVVYFNNNDGNENPFNFDVTCTVNVPFVPEIELEGPGPVNIADGGSFDLGSTLQGTPLAWTLLVRNTGTATLTLLTDPPTVTGDFLAGMFGSTSVAAGASTTFDVLCDATTLGSPVSGTISFGTNDGDENPFNFTVTCTVLEPAVLIVNSLADTNDGSCSPEDCTLREAINTANNYPGADTITFAVDGTITLASALPAITSDMAIDGQGHSVAVSGNDSVRLFTVNYGADLTLETLALQDGNAANGGAVYNAGVTEIHHTTITDNFASSKGGGIFNNYLMTISDSTISNNSTTYQAGQTNLYQGGGIVNYSQLTITNCTISGNTANYGGGIANAGTLTLDQGTVTGNLAGQGSGIWNESTALITDSSISNNLFAIFDGGGIDNYYASLSISNSTLAGNSSSFGGGIRVIGGSVTLTDTTLSENSTNTGPGGGILISHNGVVAAENSTFSQNSSGNGGGAIEVGFGSVLTATHVTFADNSASAGASISVVPAGEVNPAGTAYLAGSILDTGTGISNCYGAITDNGYNLSSDASCGFTGTGSVNNATLDLSTLGDHGGPTLTHLAGSNSAATDLIPNGTAISNHGVSYTCGPSSEPLDTDQRGFSRPAAVTGKCDSGAVEAGDRPPAPTLVSPANGSTAGSNTPIFDWNNVSGAVQYRIQADTHSNFSSPAIDSTVAVSTYTPTSALPNGIYYWRVRASNGLWGSYSSPWTVNLNSISTNANLSSLILSTGAYSPAFNSSITSYTQSVPNGFTSLTVTPTAAHSGAIIAVNGSLVASGTASSSISLSEGLNTITILVTAQDGVTTKTYSVAVTRVSSNANLSGLSLTTGAFTPAFNSATIAYTQSVGNAIQTVRVTPTAANEHAAITVNGTPVVSGNPSSSINLSVGPNPITIVVTAEDGVTNKTYTVTVARIASSNADLRDLWLSTGAFAPAFAANITAYTQSVSNSTAVLTVIPSTVELTASIKVNGVSVLTGNTSPLINLAVGPNPISVVVTAEDGVTIKTYTVTVTRAASSNANLSSLVLSTGPLTPAFSPGTTAYSQFVSNAVASLTVTPTSAESSASITVNGVAVASGSASGAISLSPGSNTITVIVTAGDGSTTRTYTVTVMKIDVHRLFLPLIVR